MGPIKLTASEWSVLDSLWQENPQTVMQLVSKLGKTVGLSTAKPLARGNPIHPLWNRSKRRSRRRAPSWIGCTGAAWG